MVGQLRNRSVEAEPCLDADGEQVERVRQLSTDQLAALSGSRAHHEIGSEKADCSEGGAEKEADAPGKCAAEDHSHKPGADPDRRLRCKEGAR